MLEFKEGIKRKETFVSGCKVGKLKDERLGQVSFSMRE